MCKKKKIKNNFIFENLGWRRLFKGKYLCLSMKLLKNRCFTKIKNIDSLVTKKCYSLKLNIEGKIGRKYKNPKGMPGTNKTSTPL